MLLRQSETTPTAYLAAPLIFSRCEQINPHVPGEAPDAIYANNALYLFVPACQRWVNVQTGVAFRIPEFCPPYTEVMGLWR